MSTKNLNSEKALIFRITHIENIPWILDHGLHCQNSNCFDPNFRSIGSNELILKRCKRSVPVDPGGTLSDYVPFYFTPFSIMMFNIHTGYSGITQIPNENILVMVSSLREIEKLGIPFVFTNQHAYPVVAKYFNKINDLENVDWPLLRARDFSHDPEDPGKKERYQAEAMVYQHVPLKALLGICCYSQNAKSVLQNELIKRKLNIRTPIQPQWYFK
jgi:hypothetical protein